MRFNDNPDETNLLSDEKLYGPFSPSEEPEAPPVGQDGWMMDSLKGVGRGVEDFGKSLWSLADTLTGDALLPDESEESIFGESTTTAGKVVEGITQFLTAFVPVAGWVGKAGKALQWTSRGAKIAQSALAGGIADFTAYKGHEERLSNLLVEIPALRFPVTEYLAADKDDGELEGRLKNTIEGLGLGLATDALFGAVKALKKARTLGDAGVEPEGLADAMKEGLGKTEDEVKGAIDAATKLDEDSIRATSKHEVKKQKFRQAAQDLADISFLNPEAHGRLNPATIIEAAETGAELHQLVDAATMHALEKYGDPTAKGILGRYEHAADRLQMLGKWSETGELRALVEGTSTDAVTVGIRAVVVENLLRTSYEDLLGKLKVFNKSGDVKDMATVIQTMDKAMFLHTGNAKIATAQSQAFSARRFTKLDENASLEKITQLVKERGGSKYLNSYFKRIGMLDSAEAVSKAVSLAGQDKRFWRVHNEYLINSMLSGVKTQVINTTGSILNSIYLPTERFLGAALNADFGTMAAYARHGVHLGQAVGDAGRFFLKSIWNNQNYLDDATKLDTHEKAISAKFLSRGQKEAQDGALWWTVDAIGKVVNIPSRMLMGTDEFFKQLNYRAHAKTMLTEAGASKFKLSGAALKDYVDGEMGKLITESGNRFSEAAIYKQGTELAKKRGLTGVEAYEFINGYVKDNYHDAGGLLAHIGESSADFAKEVTFTQDLEKGSIAMHLQNMVRAHPALQVVLPFVRTPTNILTFFAQRVLPITEVYGVKLPLVSGLHKRAMEDMASNDAVRIAAAKGRLAMGSTLLLTFAELAQGGAITGYGPDDENERKVLMETGWQPYSLKVGDKYISFARLDPLASFLGVTADMIEVANRGGPQLQSSLEKFASMSVVALQNNVSNKSYLAGLSEVFNLLSDPERYAPRLLRKQAGAYVPALAAGFGGTAGNDEVREVRSIMDAFMNRVPFANQTLEPRRNVLGEPVDARIAGGGQGFDWINPFVVSHAKKDAVMDELVTLQHGFYPPTQMLDKKFDLTAYHTAEGQTAYDRMQKLSGEVRINGKTLRQALEKLFNSPEYQKLPAPSTQEGVEDFSTFRTSKVTTVLKRYRNVALERTMKEIPQLRQDVVLFRKTRGEAKAGRTPTVTGKPEAKAEGLLGLIQ
jgi:hypothetical protein